MDSQEIYEAIPKDEKEFGEALFNCYHENYPAAMGRWKDIHFIMKTCWVRTAYKFSTMYCNF